MNNRLVLFFCLALIFSAQQGLAQLSKKEKKEWKKKAKEYAKSPVDLKQLIEEKEAVESQLSAANDRLAQLQRSVAGKDSRLAELEGQLADARAEVARARAELSQAQASPAAAPNDLDFSRGVVFRVQIGAFRNKDLQKYFDNNPNLGGEVREGDPQRITLGIFRDYWEADQFKKYMREMGVKDAWIVPYRDGERVEIKDVLEGVVTDQPQAQ